MAPVDRDRPLSLAAYDAVSRIMGPLAAILLRLRLRRGKEDASRICERRGIATLPRPDGPLIWIHGASIGEMVSSFSLIETIAKEHPHLNILMTSGTVSSAETVARRGPAGALHQFAPLDLPRYLDRFFDHWRPQLALFIESELWPNMISTLKRRRVPAALLNARMSPRSSRRWQRAPATIRSLLAGFSLCLAQTDADAARLRALGADDVRVSGNLKFDSPAPPVDETALRRLREAIGDRPVLVAASTHPGEDEQIVEAHLALAGDHAGLLTVIAPRHSDRGPAIADMVRSRNLECALRSRGDLPGRSTGVYVADTFGELGLLYRVADIVFMGGSLVPHGGQNPIEPAKVGSAILHGPNIFNFTEVYAMIADARGCRAVNSVAELVDAARSLLDDRQARDGMAERARDAVEEAGGAVARTLAALAPYLPAEKG